MKILTISILAAILTACSNEQPESVSESAPEPTLNIQPAEPDNQNESDAYQPNFIGAEDLKISMGSSTPPFVFDVRSLASFEKSHVKNALSMPYGKTTDEMLNAVSGLGKDSRIVTYCGCPHHLSTLAAADLESRGYSSVSVLYEGYWYWKDNNYPVVENTTTASLSNLSFEGQLVQNSYPVENKDIFLRHEKTGQLEAVRTNREGRFQVQFHVYDYQPEDRFEIFLTKLDQTPEHYITANLDKINELQLSL